MIYIIKNQNRDKEKVKWLISRVIDMGGIEYASNRMAVFRDEAMQILRELPQNEANTSLEAMVRYTTDRKY